MLIIYDFDGTLTPYPLARYEIFKKNGYSNERILSIVNNEMQENKNMGLYDAYYKCYQNIFIEKNIPMSRENICLGAKDVVFNKGVIEYFENFQSKKSGIKHYVVTAGVQYFVEETKISKYLDGIYGVTFIKKDDVYKGIDVFLNDKKKIDIIKKIRDDNNETSDIIYFGDGLTDQYAFEYVHSVGGKNIFVVSSEDNMKKFKEIDKNNLIDYYFAPDFSNNSEIYKYIRGQ